MIFIIIRGGMLQGCYTNVQDEVKTSIKVIDFDNFMVGENCISDLTPEWNEPAVKELIELEDTLEDKDEKES